LRDQLGALKALAMISEGTDNVRLRLIVQTRVIVEHLGDNAPALLQKLAKVWV
jgi:hypothetical protein